MKISLSEYRHNFLEMFGNLLIKRTGGRSSNWFFVCFAYLFVFHNRNKAWDSAVLIQASAVHCLIDRLRQYLPPISAPGRTWPDANQGSWYPLHTLKTKCDHRHQIVNYLIAGLGIKWLRPFRQPMVSWMLSVSETWN